MNKIYEEQIDRLMLLVQQNINTIAELQTSIAALQALNYVNYVDRGDTASADVTQATLTLDGTWKTSSPINLSSIVPEGAKSVVLEALLTNAAAATYLAFRKPGNTYSSGQIYAQVAAVSCVAQLVLPVTSTRTLEYNGSAGSTISLYVRGWFI